MKTIIKILVFILVIMFMAEGVNAQDVKKASWWSLQSIDTVKYSRDLAHEKAKDESFDTIIDSQIKAISQTGATHVSIGTPYDDEFLPFMKRWINAARKYDLNVWFRGNFSGWEEWFDYEKIDREQHKTLLKKFIEDNGELFEDGDIFTTCSECENGGPGDPRTRGDAAEYRHFLIDEYRIAKEAFRKIGKSVESNYFSMNADVAILVMNPETTKALGGVVVIDHYVGTPTKLAGDIKAISKLSGGKVVLGEFGAPIPDIHGEMSSLEQAEWVDNALHELSRLPELIGINYWTSVGGSTGIWDSSLNEKDTVSVLRKYFNPKLFGGKVIDEAGGAIKGAIVETEDRLVTTSSGGNFLLPYFDLEKDVTIKSNGFHNMELLAEDSENRVIVLKKENESFFFKIKKFFYQLFN